MTGLLLWLAGVAWAHDLAWIGFTELPEPLQMCTPVHGDHGTPEMLSVTLQCPAGGALSVMRVAASHWDVVEATLNTELTAAAGAAEPTVFVGERAGWRYGAPAVAWSLSLEKQGAQWWLSCVEPSGDEALCQTRLAPLIEAVPPAAKPAAAIVSPGLVGQ